MVIRAGTYVGSAVTAPPTQIVAEAPVFRRHRHAPWFRAYVARHCGVPARAAREARPGPACVGASTLDRQALVCGSTGSGKSRLLLHLVMEQVAAGCSVLLLDPKGETFRNFLLLAQARGLPPERLVILDPRGGETGMSGTMSGGVPGWNPFGGEVPAQQAAADFVAVVRRSASSWGPRMQDLLTNACLLIAAQGLSIFELTRALTVPAYLEALLRHPARPDDPDGYREVLAYFRWEHLARSPSERAAVVAPVLTRLREYLRSLFLRELLCAEPPTLRLAGLWTRPTAVAVHLDGATLGEEGAGLLATLLAQSLFRTALRASGPVRVVLAVDELPVLESYLGSTLAQILALARSQGLRCLAACQHLDQLSGPLRSSLLANTAAQAFFRLGPGDARLAAAVLAAGTPPSLARAVAEPCASGRERPALACWRHPVLDPHGRALRLAPAAWEEVRWRLAAAPDPAAELRALAAASGIGRLYVLAADTGSPVALHRYLSGLEPAEYWIDGPALELVVAFPRPRISGVQRWEEADAQRHWNAVLQNLPPQHAALRVAGERPGVIRVADVPLPILGAAERARYVRASQAAYGQCASEITATLRRREAEVERLAAGGSPRPAGPVARSGREEQEEASDGSIF